MILKQTQWPGPGWQRIEVRFILSESTNAVTAASADDVFWIRG